VCIAAPAPASQQEAAATITAKKSMKTITNICYLPPFMLVSIRRLQTPLLLL